MRGGPRIFRQGSSCPGVLWIPPPPRRPFAYGALTPCGRPSQAVRLRRAAASAVRNPTALRAMVWAPPVPLAATPGIDVSFSSSGYLDVSVRRVPFRCAMCSRPDARGAPRAGSPIQTPADRRAFAPPRGFSQLVASFIGPQCLGIRPAPFPLGRCRGQAGRLASASRIPAYSLRSCRLRPCIRILSLCACCVWSSHVKFSRCAFL